MSTKTPRKRRLTIAGAATCLCAGVASMAFGSGAARTTAPDQISVRPAAQHEALPASPPERIAIPRLHLAAPVVELRAADDGKTLSLPPLQRTGWDSTSATPGADGITVVTGYISRAARQPGALRGMARLRAGDVISVQRKDHKTVDYTVTGVDYYAQGQFPASQVFPHTNRPELRLISTGGPLHRGDPLGNAVVTAVGD